ncbi:MAG: hypothetical protein J7K81_00255, partial [Methanophagales archaeon]|nr:hypothetical protein [Methanophagales archaeon]
MKKKIWAIGIIAVMVLGVGLAAGLTNGNKVKALMPASTIEISSLDMVKVNEVDSQPNSPISLVSSSCESEVVYQDKAETKQITISSDMIKALGPKVEEVGTLATYSVSGTLDPNQCHLYGPWYFEQGETARIRLTWSPGSSTLLVSMCDLNGHCWGGEVTGGSCDVTLVCQTSGQYYVSICNEGPETIEYSGYITI